MKTKYTRSKVTVSKLGQIRASSDMQTPIKRPNISVIMSVFNEEAYVEDTIKSVLNQTFGDFEFIIVNDGSIDRTQEILEDYAQKDKRIKIIVNKRNIGAAKSLNNGIGASNGEYIALIDAADLCHPTRFEKQIKFLEKNKNVFMVGTYQYWIDENKKIIGIYRFPTNPVDVKKNLFGFASITVLPSVMIRKKLFEKIGFFDLAYPISMDYELFVRTIKNGFEIANIPEFLVYIARRNQKWSVRNVKAIFINMLKIRARYLPYFFNFRNVFYTAATSLFVLLPSPLLKKIVEISIANEKIRGLLINV